MSKQEPKKKLVMSPGVVAMLGMMGPYWYEELEEVLDYMPDFGAKEKPKSAES